MANFKQLLSQFDFSPTDGPEPPERVEELESLVGVRLPDDYRNFLLEVGGGYTDDLLAECTVPTPFGEHILVAFESARQVMGLLDSNITPRNMICIGSGHCGSTTCLSVAGLDHGQVFAFDMEMRFFWNDEIFSRFPSLDPSISEFFRLRDADELPERPWGYENCYHVADSFSEFLRKLRRN